jgi:hypothetical protein
MEKQSFLRNHIDTITIIGVNIAIAAVALNICFTNISSINATNARMDAANARLDTMQHMIYDLLKEMRK